MAAKVEMWKALDGSLFPSEQEALDHEMKYRLMTWLESMDAVVDHKVKRALELLTSVDSIVTITWKEA